MEGPTVVSLRLLGQLGLVHQVFSLCHGAACGCGGVPGPREGLSAAGRSPPGGGSEQRCRSAEPQSLREPEVKMAALHPGTERQLRLQQQRCSLPPPPDPERSSPHQTPLTTPAFYNQNSSRDVWRPLCVLALISSQ